MNEQVFCDLVVTQGALDGFRKRKLIRKGNLIAQISVGILDTSLVLNP